MAHRVLGDPIERDPRVPRRAVRLAFFGRFTDELLFGAVDVLMPALRAAFGLSYAQIGLLHLALEYVSGLVEPVAALLIDVWERRWLLALGAVGVGVATALVGLAPTFLVLLVAFALYGVASGPLAHTADVVLVEAHPKEPGRAFARATALDTTGALLGPLLVAAWAWAGLEWRWLLVGLGGWGVGYGLLLAGTRFPRTRAGGHEEGEEPGEADAGASGPSGPASTVRAFVENLRAVASDRAAKMWLLLLFVHGVVEAALIFRAVWLVNHAGMGQAQVGLYVGYETAISLLGVLYLDRWLKRAQPRRVLVSAALALLVLYPAWYLVPVGWARWVLGAPLGFLFATFWPIARSESLVTESARPGAVTAISSVMGLVPLALFVALLAEAVGLTAALLGTQFTGMALLLLIVWRWLPAPRDAARARVAR